MSRQYLNLTAGAWSQLRRNWRLPASPMLVWQNLVPGSLFSALTKLQRVVHGEQLAQAQLKNPVVVLGYWRSGTTLLHELLCRDTRFWYPTTHACMNPHHFLITEASALARGGAAVQRPMDEMEVRPGSPQEDEFALLSLGARSPYEALLVPGQLAAALKLADALELTPFERQQWRSIFLNFLKGVSVRGSGRPLILKSPTHGYRVATLRELLPDARYILIVRNPATHFESVIRMWRRMFETYSFQPIPPADEIREAVLTDRMRFEAKLAAGTAGLPANRFAAITYESLVADPAGVCEHLYRALDLGDYGPVRDAIRSEVESRRDYRAHCVPAPGNWRQRINSEWGPIFAQYGYSQL